MRRIPLVVLCFLCFVLAAVGASAERLPLIAFPEHYDLRFVPDLEAETFAGETVIRIRVLERTARIVLHAAELQIVRATVAAGGRTDPAAVTANVEAETITLDLPVTLEPGPAEVRVVYAGILNRQLRGFYISEANGRKYAVTQLEATDARRMFPSFDEPHYKATFGVTAVIDATDYAISNGAVTSAVPGPAEGKQTIEFATTAPMSTYLVALAVGDFRCIEDAAGGTPLRVCATPDKLALTAFAMEATKGVLEYFNEYFATDYPFAKLDQVAIPDFAAGAMENTGAVFYRESILLVDSTSSTLAARKRAAAVIAHEIAHHWFGNLVTMRWWDDLWLNEGFATWMEAKAVAAWKPQWTVRQDEVQSVQNAMGIDALRSTRPIRVQAETPGEINELFDPIAYEKGAAILRMVEAYVGAQPFRGGVNAYLETHAYENATAEDFWNVMTRATREPVDRIMASFVDEPGLPVVTLATSCRDGRSTVTLAQQQYSRDGASRPDIDRLWNIPVCLRWPEAGGTEEQCHLLDEQVTSVTIDRCVPWIVGNVEARGYYRTAYTDAVVRALARSDGLRPVEAIMLLADEWALLRAGRHHIDRVLDVTAAVVSDTGAVGVAESAVARLNYVHEYLTTPESRRDYEAWVRAALTPVLRQRADGDSDPTAHADAQRLRSALLMGLGIAGRDPQVLRDARRSIDRHLRGDDTIHPALINTMVHLAATAGDDRLYDRYLAKSRTAATPEMRYRYLYALAAFREPALVRRTLEHAMSDRVRSQDRAGLLAAVLGNPAGRDLAWSVIRTQWRELEKSLSGFSGTSRIVEGLGAFCDPSRASAIQEFFADHPLDAGERTLGQTLERVRACAALASAERKNLERWAALQPTGF